MRNGDFAIDDAVYGIAEGVFVEEVSPGTPGWRVQDQLNPVGDDRYFGRDYLTPPSWQLKLGTNGRTMQDSLDALAAVSRTWNTPIRRPGEDQVLRYRINDRTRRLYGRCRGVVEYDPNHTLRQGYVPASVRFETRDVLNYDDTEQTVTVQTVAAESGGAVLPATLPFTLSPSGARSGLISEVGGNADTPVTITVFGPVTGVWAVTVGGHRVEMNHTMAFDRSVRIDTRTMTVLGDDGSNLSGKLSRRVYLPDVKLSPGPSEVIFERSDLSDTSSCTVGWHSAFQGF